MRGTSYCLREVKHAVTKDSQTTKTCFLTELMLKRHRLSSDMNDVANTVPVSFDAEAGTVVANSDMVPVSLDAETGPLQWKVV